jgi:iron complex outermembrane receptor protein
MKNTSISLLALAVASISAPSAFAADRAPNEEPGITDAAPDAPAPQKADEIIVTGTRTTGLTAVESSTPIKLLDADLLEKVGQPNLNQVLTQLVPSFTAQAFGGDTANLTLSARLRGLSPNHTDRSAGGRRGCPIWF